jgi:hypothetical protein
MDETALETDWNFLDRILEAWKNIQNISRISYRVRQKKVRRCNACNGAELTL